jgi:hypothetical protein
MKRKITLLLLAAASAFSVNSQVLFQEDFTSPFTPTGWSIQNLSASANPTLAWFQGNGAQVFPAFNGGPNDYVGVNYNSSTSSAPATLSTWLITPTLNIANGNVVEFATRTTTTATTPFPDRLEVYLSTDAGTNVGSTPTSLGTFSTLLVSVNPNLTTTGYPTTWTVYQATITGVTTPTVGRVGFRYHVTNGGPSLQAANSDYVGLDAVKYFVPCTQPTLTASQSTGTICAGQSVTLTASVSGTVPVSTFTWSHGGQNTTSIVVTPSTTTTYTVSGDNAGCVGSTTVVVTVDPTPTIQVSSYTVCAAASTTTLQASGATTYSWDNGATTSSIVVAPSTTTEYTVVGFSASGLCSSSATSTITVSGLLSVNISASSNTICSGRTLTLTANSSATSYTWSTGQTAPTITVIPTTSTVYTVDVESGTPPNTCTGSNTISINVLPSPTLQASLSPTPVCSGADFTVTASGATSYTYVLSQTSAATVNPLPLTAPNVNSLTSAAFVLGGTGANGCVSAIGVTVQVNPNPTVVASASSPTVCNNGTVTLNGTGADAYQWSGASTSTDVPLTYSPSTIGNKSFTLTGTSTAGCKGTSTVDVTVVTCNTNTNNPVGIVSVGANGETSIFPNPFSAELNINVLDGKVVIFNALGQAVITTQVNSSKSINTSDLPKGAYMLKAYNMNGELVKTVKLIKN